MVRVSGPEAASFLQGVLTQDVETLAPLQARYGALLTPQGKILFDFLVVRMPGAEPAFALDCPAPLAPGEEASENNNNNNDNNNDDNNKI